MLLPYSLCDLWQRVGERNRYLLAVFEDFRQDEHLGCVTLRGANTWTHDVRQSIFRSQQQYVRGFAASRSVRPCCACCDMGCDIQGQGAFAGRRITVNQYDFSLGNMTRPEPQWVFRLHISQASQRVSTMCRLGFRLRLAAFVWQDLEL